MFWEPQRWIVTNCGAWGDHVWFIQTGVHPVTGRKMVWRDGRDGMEGKVIAFASRGNDSDGKAKAEKFLEKLRSQLTTAPPPPPEPKPEPKPAPAKKSPGRPKKDG